MSQKIGNTVMSTARVWHLIDCKKDLRTMGRISQDVVNKLMGKHKPIYHPSADVGDYVVLINCNSLEFLPSQLRGKFYYRPSLYPGRLKVKSLKEKLFEKGPKWAIYRSIYRMLPKNRSKKERAGRLFVFDGDEYPYSGNILAHAREQAQVIEEKAKCEEINTKIIDARKKFGKLPELMKNLKL
ncbi:ribosomal protein L13 [Hanseniaspora valbyensis NRRL Y-1626]|uniref:Ribosomal protein L13 n=1 Tax=Hanseniaspora valbyensis NRRL Y-1626 TaxID=766949 RepID=A0A1B7TCA5_9ASCO|nr:ribosomal protein L13 [Hanseniaspora valbyensis NRRL Y-1626]